MDLKKHAPLRITDIRSKYKVVDKVGKGTYGTVFKALNLQDNKYYAIKKFQNTDPKLQVEGFPITALREISLLKEFNHPHIINLRQIICSKPNKRNLFRGSTFMVFDYMHHDFAGLFRSKIKFTLSQIKCIMKQLLEGCNFLHQNKVMHRDIKSANILMDDKGTVQLADFGLGRRTRFDNVYTYKVVTLWYRAPQLLLGCKTYNHKVDVWSLGCVFAEFLINEVLFKKETQYAIIQKIYQICGDLESNEFTEDYLSGCVYYNEMKPKKLSRNTLVKYIKKLSPSVDDLTIEFLQALLELNPYKRLSCEEALQHEFFKSEPKACQPQKIQKFEVQYHEMFRDRSLQIQRKQSLDWSEEEQRKKKKEVPKDLKPYKNSEKQYKTSIKYDLVNNGVEKEKEKDKPRENRKEGREYQDRHYDKRYPGYRDQRFQKYEDRRKNFFKQIQPKRQNYYKSHSKDSISRSDSRNSSSSSSSGSSYSYYSSYSPRSRSRNKKHINYRREEKRQIRRNEQKQSRKGEQKQSKKEEIFYKKDQQQLSHQEYRYSKHQPKDKYNERQKGGNGHRDYNSGRDSQKNYREETIYLKEKVSIYKQRPIDYKQRPIDYKQRPIDYKQRPIDYKQRPIDYKQRPINYKQRSINYKQRSIDCKQRSNDYKQRSNDYKQRSNDYKQRPSNQKQGPNDFYKEKNMEQSEHDRKFSHNRLIEKQFKGDSRITREKVLEKENQILERKAKFMLNGKHEPGEYRQWIQKKDACRQYEKDASRHEKSQKSRDYQSHKSSKNNQDRSYKQQADYRPARQRDYNYQPKQTRRKENSESRADYNEKEKSNFRRQHLLQYKQQSSKTKKYSSNRNFQEEQ